MQKQCSPSRVCRKFPRLEVKESLIKEQQNKEFHHLGTGDVLNCMFGCFGSSLEDEYIPELDWAA